MASGSPVTCQAISEQGTYPKGTIASGPATLVTAPVNTPPVVWDYTFDKRWGCSICGLQTMQNQIGAFSVGHSETCFMRMPLARINVSQ